MNQLVAAMRRIAYLVRYRRARASLEREDACSLFGLDLLVAPRVLHPRHFISSQLLARQVLALDLDGKTVADIGTGSGILGLLAARSGATVTAVDLNPGAVACAIGNAQRNGLADRVRVIESDVFESVPAEARFDLVITNPPFYPRAAESLPDHAFAAGVGNGFFARLAESLPGRLTKGGALLMIQSSDTDFLPLGRMFEDRGMPGRIVSERRSFFETLTIREFRAPESAPATAAGA
jgi:release factor glutamine methyltransferase